MRQPRILKYFHFFLTWLASHYHRPDISEFLMSEEDSYRAIEADPPYHLPQHWYWKSPRGKSFKSRLPKFAQEIPFQRSVNVITDQEHKRASRSS